LERFFTSVHSGARQVFSNQTHFSRLSGSNVQGTGLV